MGCSGSKPEDLPLVLRCRERRELIRAAAHHRYALAAAHVAYFRSLKDVGNALRKFVDEELVVASSSSSSFSSPSLTLPPDAKKKHGIADESSLHLHDDADEDVDEESHLHLSDSSSEDGDSEDYHHGHESEEDAAHQHHNHGASRVHKGKGIDDGIGHSIGEGESSSFYPRGGFNGYGSGVGDGFVNYSYPYPYPSNPYPNQYPNPYAQPSYGGPYMDQWGGQPAPEMQPWHHSANSNAYYMKKSAPTAKTVVQEPPAMSAYGYSDSYWNSVASYANAGYGGSQGYFPVGSPMGRRNNEGVEVNPQKQPPPSPPPPPAPQASTWDFFNPFDGFESGYPGYYSTGGYGYGSNASSPDSNEVREREGIPDLEEETESEVYKEVLKRNGMKTEAKKSAGESSPHGRAVPARKIVNDNARSVPQQQNVSGSRPVPQKGAGSSRSVPVPNSESSSRSLPSWSGEETEKPSMSPMYYRERETAKAAMPAQFNEESARPSMMPPHGKADQPQTEERSDSISLVDESPDSIVRKSVDEGSLKKKGVTFEMDSTSKQDADSSNLSSVTILSPHGTRDLQEVVAEIRDEFETASGYGKEVAMLLEVGKLPYQPSFLKVIISRLLYLISPSISLPDPPVKSTKLGPNSVKFARSYFEDVGKDVNSQACNLSSTLDKLYVWEKKLYKEVKNEEQLRVIYEKQCKRMKALDEEGAETGKIDTVRDSIRKLLTKLDVSIKAIDAVSTRIHKLRDEELQPQVAALIHGLIKMWKAMLRCHRKQFQAIMESKMRKLRANTADHGDSGLRATTQLERELRAWCEHFNNWVSFQKAYVESLNGWLLQCLEYEPEETPDGPVPFSPGRLQAPSIFVIGNDWKQAMEGISESRVASAMNTFATSLQQLWVKQDEERHQRLKAEYLSKDYDKQLKAQRMEQGKMKLEHDDKTELSVVPSDNGVSPLDDLKVDLDSMKHRLTEERTKHKDAMKLVHEAASSSLQGGLIPIFKALENFTSEALKAHEHVRLQPTTGMSS